MPAPSEAFANLEDRLLRGGIAPRHVKRYLRELSEHLADLTAAQRDAGFDAEDAAARTRAALGGFQPGAAAGHDRRHGLSGPAGRRLRQAGVGPFAI